MGSSRSLLLLGLAALALGGGGGCRSSPVGFQGFRVRSVRADLQQQQVKLALSLDFRVRNPLTVPLVVPRHTFTMTLGSGAQAFTHRGELERATVAPGEVKLLTYDVDLDLAGLPALAGQDVPYAFAASVDVIEAAREQTAQLLPKQLVPGFNTVEDRIRSALPANLQPGPLVLAHESTVRLPRLPTLRWPATGPKVELVGERPWPTLDVSPLIEALRRSLKPLTDALKVALQLRPPSVQQLTLWQLLDRLGVRDYQGPPGCSGRTCVTINGKQKVLDAINAVPGVSVGRDHVIVAAASPPAPLDMFPEVLTAWNNLIAWQPPEELKRFTPPGGLPTGVRVRLPFQVQNTNRFPVRLPELTLELLSPAGGALARITVAATRIVPPSDGDAQRCSAAPPGAPLPPPTATMVPCLGALDMELSSELTWNDLAALPQLFRGPFTLSGQVTLDLGYGMLTLPLTLSSSSLPPH